MTYKDYALICIGEKDKRLKIERIDRQQQWLLYIAVKDPKKAPFTMFEWWAIEGDPKQRPMPSHDQITAWDKEFRNIGKKKNA